MNRSKARPRKQLGLLCLAIAALAGNMIGPASAQPAFPFEQEMLMDVPRLPDAKRVPILEILSDGRAVIDLWCKSGEGAVRVNGNAISITLGPMREESCTPERLQRDEELALALSQVTEWSVEEDTLILTGPTELHYRLSSH